MEQGPQRKLTGFNRRDSLLCVMRRRVSWDSQRSVRLTSSSGQQAWPNGWRPQCRPRRRPQPEPQCPQWRSASLPRAQKGLNRGPGQAAARAGGHSGPDTRSRRALLRPIAGSLVASILISLVPTAIILALLWQGAIRLPGSERTRSSLSIEDPPADKPAGLGRPARLSVETVRAEDRHRAHRSGPDRG